MAKKRNPEMVEEQESTAMEPEIVAEPEKAADPAEQPQALATTEPSGAFVGLNTKFRTRIHEIYSRRADIVDKILDREERTNAMLEQADAVSQERADQLDLFVKLQGLHVPGKQHS